MYKHEKQYLILRDFIQNQYENMPSTWMNIWNDINEICRGEFYDFFENNSAIRYNDSSNVSDLIEDRDLLEEFVNSVKKDTYRYEDKYVEFCDSGEITTFNSLACKKLDCLNRLEFIYNRELDYKADDNKYEEMYMQDLFKIFARGMNE